MIRHLPVSDFSKIHFSPYVLKEPSGKLEIVEQMAAHESSRTTGLYDRRGDEVIELGSGAFDNSAWPTLIISTGPP